LNCRENVGLPLATDPAFLFPDRLPQPARDSLYREIQSGSIVVRSVTTKNSGNPIDVPDGMVHHWIGLVFIRGKSLAQAESLLLDYNNYATIRAPEMRRSKTLAHSDDTHKILVQFFTKSPLTSFDVYSDARYFNDNPQHVSRRALTALLSATRSALSQHCRALGARGALSSRFFSPSFCA
jgi:hypothetical protein